ncbi:MAG TPA: PAS domain S-box protein, partial [Trichocoleus sp.]
LPKSETLVGTALLGQPWMGEVRMQNRAGEQVDVLLRIDPIKNLQGQVTGLLVIHTDISKRHTTEQTLQQLNLKLETRVLERTAELEATNAQLQVEIEQRQQAEGRIRRSEAELRTMTEASPVGIFRTDPRGNISYVNQSLLDICGCSRTDMLNGSWIKTLDPKSRRAILQGWVQLLQGDQEFRDEVYLRRLDGGERWAVVKAVPFYDGLDLLGYVGTLDDISDRKSAEEALKESEGRFRSLVENAQDIIYSLNLEGRFTYVAPNWTRVLGHPISEVQGKLFEPFVHVDDLATCWQALQKLVASGQEQTDVEYRVLHQDGTWRWHISNVSGLTDQNGNVVMLVGIAHDITERRQAEQALRITNDQLRQANTELAQATRLKDEFLATMSHELRTPLNAVIGLSEGLLEEVYGPFNPRQQKALRTIERSGRHLLDLINDILDLSKIEAGKLELSVQPTLIYPLCETSIALIRPQAERKKINLTLSVTEAVTSIEVDERRIRQILINLLSNAVKFTPNSGSIRLEVCLEEREKTNSETALPSAVLLQVHDTGIGIAAEDLSKLFQPFSQIDTRLARSHSGTGLGLALVRRLAELHNGSVSVTSVVGEGSSFTVRIPLKHPWKDCVEWPTSTRALPTSKWAAETLCSPGSQTPGLAPLILLAEDNIANIEAIADFLKYEGYRVIYAQNGLEAFKQAKQHRPDCILMDVQMPLVDGLDATSRIRNDLDLANTPIIALTALAMPEDHDRCLQVGMTDYLTKPIRLKYLLSTIQKYLAHE